MSENSEETGGRTTPYVVLEKEDLFGLVEDLLENSSVELDAGIMAHIAEACEASEDKDVYVEVRRLPARNSAHALTQVGRTYQPGEPPILVAVTERMFKPKPVNVTYNPSVSIG